MPFQIFWRYIAYYSLSWKWLKGRVGCWSREDPTSWSACCLSAWSLLLNQLTTSSSRLSAYISRTNCSSEGRPRQFFDRVDYYQEAKSKTPRSVSCFSRQISFPQYCMPRGIAQASVSARQACKHSLMTMSPSHSNQGWIVPQSESVPW